MRWGVVMLAVVSTASCSSGESGTSLPACARELPVPESVEVVEVTATPTGDNPTCAVTLASEAAIDAVVTSWVTALENDGVEHDIRHDKGRQAVLQLRGPVCGSVLVFAAGTERVTEAVGKDQTPALASVIECPDQG